MSASDTPPATPQAAAEERQDRRRFLRSGATVVAGAAAAAAGAAATTPAAHASPGDAMLLGRLNNSGATRTALTSTSSSPTLGVHNSGPGAGALVTSLKTNALAAGTNAKDFVGLSVANYSDTKGRGAAVAAGGGRNHGVVASTIDANSSAVVATNINADRKLGIGAAVVATAGGGVIPILANQLGGHGPAIIAYGEQLPDGTYNESIHAIGGVFALGDTFIDGDLYVSGTLYCDDVQPYPSELRQEHAAKVQEMEERAGKHADFAAEEARRAH